MPRVSARLGRSSSPTTRQVEKKCLECRVLPALTVFHRTASAWHSCSLSSASPDSHQDLGLHFCSSRSSASRPVNVVDTLQHTAPVLGDMDFRDIKGKRYTSFLTFQLSRLCRVRRNPCVYRSHSSCELW